MREKAVMGLIAAVALLFVSITLADLIGNIGKNTESVSKDNEDTTVNMTDKDDASDEDNVSDNIFDNESGNQENDNEAVDNEKIICASGMTLATRINTPDGYVRITAEDKSLISFLRAYKMKEDGSKVLLYDSSEKGNQDAHVAIFELPLENRNLQHAADTVMRVYSEYYLATGQYDKIAFHYSDGFLASYSKWIEGYRINVKEGVAKWIKDDSCDISYESFQEYMRMVFAYAGVWSLKTDTYIIQLSDISVGDVFLQSGSDGHVVMVVDECIDENGKKAYLLAQGNKPAQQFHVIKNPLHPEDPWYYEDELVYPLKTPEYTYLEEAQRRLNN